MAPILLNALAYDICISYLKTFTSQDVLDIQENHPWQAFTFFIIGITFMTVLFNMAGSIMQLIYCIVVGHGSYASSKCVYYWIKTTCWFRFNRWMEKFNELSFFEYFIGGSMVTSLAPHLSSCLGEQRIQASLLFDPSNYQQKSQIQAFSYWLGQLGSVCCVWHHPRVHCHVQCWMDAVHSKVHGARNEIFCASWRAGSGRKNHGVLFAASTPQIDCQVSHCHTGKTCLCHLHFLHYFSLVYQQLCSLGIVQIAQLHSSGSYFKRLCSSYTLP